MLVSWGGGWMGVIGMILGKRGVWMGMGRVIC